jgi:hypothetical protein
MPAPVEVWTAPPVHVAADVHVPRLPVTFRPPLAPVPLSTPLLARLGRESEECGLEPVGESCRPCSSTGQPKPLAVLLDAGREIEDEPHAHLGRHRRPPADWAELAVERREVGPASASQPTRAWCACGGSRFRIRVGGCS